MLIDAASNDFMQDAGALTMPIGSTQHQRSSDSGIAFGMIANQWNMTQSPLGMDFGEFMIEGDLEFLNQFSVPNGMDDRAHRNFQRP
jgi:hypothetical protein